MTPRPLLRRCSLLLLFGVSALGAADARGQQNAGGVRPQSWSARSSFLSGSEAPSTEASAAVAAETRINSSAPLEGPLDPRTYRVDKGDVLAARFWGEQNFDLSLPIDPDGRLFVPRVGYVAAHGRTLAAVSEEVLALVQKRYPRLKIAVTLGTPRTFLVEVTGAVERSGVSYPATAWTRASDVIHRAGGVTRVGSLRAIELHRDHGKVEVVDLIRYPIYGDRSADPVLLDGDRLHVPLATRAVTISGAVNRPGTYELLQGTFAELLDLAGGLLPEANPRALRLSSIGGRERNVRLVAWDRAHPEAAPPLLHHDSLIVPTVDEGTMIVVKGALGGTDPTSQKNDPRLADTTSPMREITVSLPYQSGDTVRGAILKAGGLAAWADLSSAWIQHSSVVVRAQAVGVKDSASRAGVQNVSTGGSGGGGGARGSTGSPLGGEGRVPIDLRPIFQLDDRSKDLPLLPGDTIYVPSGRVDVVVSGHVMKPGVYGYSLNLNASDYLALAGGETREGNRGGTRVVSSDGHSQKYRDALRLQPGDSIVVPGKRLTTAEWVSISVGVISMAMSATMLGYTLRR